MDSSDGRPRGIVVYTFPMLDWYYPQLSYTYSRVDDMTSPQAPRRQKKTRKEI